MKNLAQIKTESWVKAALYGLLLVGHFLFLSPGDDQLVGK